MTSGVLPRLSRLLPNADQTTFLLATVGHDDVAADAWHRWWRDTASLTSSPARALAPYKDLLPLLSWNLARHDVSLDPSIATHLRAVRVTEALRLAKYHEICRDVFGVLDTAGTPFLVLGGAALGERCYPAPASRHCDDLELLLAPRDVSGARAALAARGWSPRHSSGMPVELRDQLLARYARLTFGGLWARRQPATVAERDVVTLSDTDLLIQTCVQGLSRGVSLRWVPDAWFLLTGGRGPEWNVLVPRTIDGGVTLPMYAALSYIASAIGDVVPGDALRELGTAARGAGRREWAAALMGLRTTHSIGARVRQFVARGYRFVRA